MLKKVCGLLFVVSCWSLAIDNSDLSSISLRQLQTINYKPETRIFAQIYTIVMAAKTDLFQSPDYFLVDDLLTDEHKLIRDSVRAYVKKEISPIIEDYAQRAEFPQQIVTQLGDLGCFRPTVPAEYGGGGLDYISYGLMMQELERGDSGVRSTASVQGSLVMFPIYQYGSEAQRKKYLPKLASGEWLGCFGLTNLTTVQILPVCSPISKKTTIMLF